MNILYLTYDGLCDPLGQSQIFPYLKGLSGKGIHFTVISLEKRGSKQCFSETKEKCNSINVNWIPLKYIESDSGWKAFLNIWKLYRKTKEVIKKQKIDFIHCRSYIPAIVALKLKVPYLFDIRGFWIDERIEGKIWSLNNPLHRWTYQFLKNRESYIFKNAGYIISLTTKALPHIHSLAPEIPVSVIPCVANPDHFVPLPGQKSLARLELEIKDTSEVIVYLGSLGSWYMPEEMMDFFKTYQISNPDAIFLLITPDGSDTVFKLTQKKGVPQASIRFLKASRNKVPFYLSAADFAISFIRDLPSKTASSPTKIAEYALMGLPVIYNPVGDLIDEPVVGYIINEFSTKTYLDTIEKLKNLKISQDLIRQKALSSYNMNEAVENYLKAYNSILSSSKVDVH